MTDWSAVRTAYGTAENVPALLAAAEAGEKTAWDDLWSNLCHQGTVYSASYAAIPALADLAERAAPSTYVDPLYLAAMIVASHDRYAEAAEVDVQGEYAPELERLRHVAALNLTLAENDRDLIYAVQCLVALEGVPIWANQLDRLAEGLTDAECGECRAIIEVDLQETPTTPADPQALDPGATRVHGLLQVRPEAAVAFLRLAGTVSCPECGATVSIPQSVA